MPLSAGDRLGPYEILSLIGKGGMGEVYRARDTRLGRDVAIKVSQAQFSERFEREARAVAALNHPHICMLYDVGPNYLVMEYIEGAHLKGPLRVDQALKYAAQICDALDAAHCKSITHRDLKPGNILVTKAGVKLLDFGLAKLSRNSGAISEETATQALTRDNTILGTLQYMSPEQLHGKMADPRSDIFSFGLVLHEMLTGKRAFDGPSQAGVIGAILEREAPSVAGVAPSALDRLLRKCLAKDPDDRWQSARDLESELTWIADGGSLAGPPVKAAQAQPLAWAIAAIAVVAALVLAFLFFGRAPEQPAATKLFALPRANSVISTDSAPVISPDGRRVAFVAQDSSGTSLLWVRPLDSLTAQPLAGTEDARQPFWKPDSRSIGFFAQTKLKRMDTSGGSPETVSDVGSAASFGGTWGLDDVILFVRSSLSPIESIPAGGGQPKPVTALDRSRQERYHSFPHFLPDGRHFLYLAVSTKEGNTAVYAGSIDSKETKRLFNVESEVRYAAPGYLLFMSDGNLIAQPFDAGRLALTGELFTVAEHVASDSFFFDGMFSVSANGVLVYRSGGGRVNTQLTWFDPDGTPLGPVGHAGEYLNPELSPDGLRVAFERRSAKGDRDIWLMELSTGIPSLLVFGSSDEYGPIWTPEGDRITFGSNRDNSFGLYQKLSSGAGSEERLFSSPDEVFPNSWSKEHSLLYRVAGPKGLNQVWVLPQPVDSKPHPYLLSEVFSQSSSRVSPNGRWVLYQSNESGRNEVWLRSFPQPDQQWPVSTGGGMAPRWSRDGKKLFYLAPDTKKLMAVAVTGDAVPVLGPLTPLFETHLLGGTRAVQLFRHQWDVARDGRFLMNVPVEENASSPITVVLNWTAGLKK